jgi:hypothetical protein
LLHSEKRGSNTETRFSHLENRHQFFSGGKGVFAKSVEDQFQFLKNSRIRGYS